MSPPIFPYDVWQQGMEQVSVVFNRDMLRTQVLLSQAISDTVSEQPASPADGDAYVMGPSPTGSAWSLFEELDMAIFRDGTWYAFSPVLGVRLNVAGQEKVFNGEAWIDFGSGGGGGSIDWLKASESDEAEALGEGSVALGPGAKADDVGSKVSADFLGSQASFFGYPGYVTVSDPGLFEVGEFVVPEGVFGGEEQSFPIAYIFGQDLSFDDVHSFIEGQTVTISGSPEPGTNGSWPIASIPDPFSVVLGGGFNTDGSCVGAMVSGFVEGVDGKRFEVVEVLETEIALKGWWMNHSEQQGQISSIIRGGLAVGAGSSATADGSVAIGTYTKNDEPDSVAFGMRRLSQVSDPIGPMDAVNVQTYQRFLPTPETTSTIAGTLLLSTLLLGQYPVQRQTASSVAYIDGKVVMASSDMTQVSTWNIRFICLVDASGVASFSAYQLDPIEVDPAHASVTFTPVDAQPDYPGWMLECSGPQGDRFSITAKSTMV